MVQKLHQVTTDWEIFNLSSKWDQSNAGLALLQINRIEQINILIDNLAGGNAAQSALEHIPGAELPPGIVDARDAGIDALESIRSMNNSQIDLLLEQLQASSP